MTTATFKILLLLMDICSLSYSDKGFSHFPVHSLITCEWVITTILGVVAFSSDSGCFSWDWSNL